MPHPARQLLPFYLLSFLLALVIALALIELGLRQLAFTNGSALAFGPQQRWYTRHWKPLNELGLRDLPLEGRLQDSTPRLYFLGDSFTAGNGVGFDETYYFRSAWQPRLDYQPFNLSRPGASTRKEIAELQRFNRETGGQAAVVVHQYFPNDIDDHITMPTWSPSPALAAAARQLETAQVLLAWQFSRDWGTAYGDALRRAYLDEATLARHLADVDALHMAIRAQGGRVLFLVFPVLSPEASLEESLALVARLRARFAASCRPGDVFLDASVPARSLSLRERRLSQLDAHPSPALHALVADQVRAALTPTPDGAGTHSCAALRSRAPADRPDA